MAKFVVEKDCYGFRLRSWKKGEIVEVQEGEKPPTQFTPLDKPKKGNKPETKE